MVDLISSMIQQIVKEHSSGSNSKFQMSLCPILHNIVELIPNKLSASIRLPRYKRIHGRVGTREGYRGFKGFLGATDREGERAFSRFEIMGDRLTRGHSFNLSSRCWAVDQWRGGSTSLIGFSQTDQTAATSPIWNPGQSFYLD